MPAVSKAWAWVWACLLGISLWMHHKPVAAHAPSPALPPDVLMAWNLAPWLVICLLLSGAAYGAGLARLWAHSGYGHGVKPRQAWLFAGGWCALAIALASPLDAWGGWLFSAHMLQHELLMLLAAPLMVMGRPLAVFAWALPNGFRKMHLPRLLHTHSLACIWQWLVHPLIAWLMHAIVLWAWHAPYLFQLALRSEPWHIVQHASFFLTALLFWWVILQQPHGKDKRGWAMLLLFTTMLHTGALGALLTIASSPWYSFYIPTTQSIGIGALEDQQLGGLIMWVPSSSAYLLAGLAISMHYLKKKVINY